MLSLFEKAFDIFASLLVIVFFAGYLNIHSGLLGLESPIPVGKQVEEFWGWLTWAVLVVVGLDLYLKYRKVRNPKEFVRRHWLDILMIAFLSLFAGFKIAKIAVKTVKGASLQSLVSRPFWARKSFRRQAQPRSSIFLSEFLSGLKDVDYADAPEPSVTL